ncbi:hypothetical protein BHE74_00031938 [Ensete ventricosum]|nr:hypothetical protein BHE74_00031938 [Ensete ventricosum]
MQSDDEALYNSATVAFVAQSHRCWSQNPQDPTAGSPARSPEPLVAPLPCSSPLRSHCSPHQLEPSRPPPPCPPP